MVGAIEPYRPVFNAVRSVTLRNKGSKQHKETMR